MTARPAYISSFATTGILVASSLLMLALFGTFVAFHRWPQPTGTGGVNQVGIRSSLIRSPIFPSLGLGPAVPAPHRPAVNAGGTAHGLVKVVPQTHQQTIAVANGPQVIDPSTPAGSPAAATPAPAAPIASAAGPQPSTSPGAPAPVAPLGPPAPGSSNPVQIATAPAEQVVGYISPGAAAEVGTVTDPVSNAAGDLTGTGADQTLAGL